MTSEERLEQQRRIWAAIKAAWKLNQKLRLGELIVTAMNELESAKPSDLFDVEDGQLLRALERFIVKTKKVDHRRDERKKK